MTSGNSVDWSMKGHVKSLIAFSILSTTKKKKEIKKKKKEKHNRVCVTRVKWSNHFQAALTLIFGVIMWKRSSGILTVTITSLSPHSAFIIVFFHKSIALHKCVYMCLAICGSRLYGNDFCPMGWVRVNYMRFGLGRVTWSFYKNSIWTSLSTPSSVFGDGTHTNGGALS